MGPLISIVIATRNAAATLPRCLESIRAQTFRDFEVVVMDGASTDATADMLARFGAATWRSEPDTGIYNAWNKALKLARGEWICFLGADDRLWDESVLERMAPYLNEAAVNVVYGRLCQVDAAGDVIAEAGVPWEDARTSFRSYRCLPQPGLMHRRALFDAHGGFDESFRIAADYEFLLRELKSGDAEFAPVVTVAAGFGGLTTRPENFSLMYGEIGRALAKHGLRPPPLRWAWLTGSARLYGCVRALAGDRGARRLLDLYRRLTLRKPRYAQPSPE